MTTFPAAGDYYKAVQAPALAFTVPKLRAAEFVWDALGPTLARGSSAVVFQAAVDGRPQALRCYIRNDASSRDRYSALGAYLARHDLSPVVSGTTWHDSAIRVKGATWPVLQMEWIDGRTLNEYVDFLVAGANTAALATLAGRWREMVALLQNSGFAHGDLQHGNVMVDQEGKLRLVDFDGVWIPQLAEHAPPSEYGHANYQHPARRDWGRWLDTFSALVIYLSLVALSKDPSLWLALYNSKNLLFAKADFFPPFETQAWKQLAALHDPQVDELTRRLQECCAADWVPDRSLEMTLAQPPAAPEPSAIPAELRWWERESAAPAAHSVAAAAAASPPTVIIPAAVSAAASLPAPPPLSAPLGLAGTGPLPPLRPTMAPAGATWWTGSGPGAAQGPVRPVPPPGPLPPGPLPPGPVPPRPWPPAPAPSGPAVKSPQAQTAGALSLGLGLVLLVVGAASHVNILVIIGLIAAAWGVWRLVTLIGTNTKPPGPT